MAENNMRIHKQDEVRRFCENFPGSRRQYVEHAARPAVHRSISGRVANSAASASVNANWREHSLTSPIELKAVDFQREYVVMRWERLSWKLETGGWFIGWRSWTRPSMT